MTSDELYEEAMADALDFLFCGWVSAIGDEPLLGDDSVELVFELVPARRRRPQPQRQRGAP